MNELDRAIAEAGRSPAGAPALYRALLEGELWALVPFQPGVDDDVMELENGMPFPFVQLEDRGAPIVPIFSSEERLHEALEKAGISPEQFSAAAMPARQMLEVIGVMNLRVVLNKGCATGTLVLPANLLRDLASGVALEPLAEEEETVGRRLKVLDPADYPTDLVQPLFEILRRHREFRAAWIFHDLEKPSEPKAYEILVYMDPRDKAIFHDLNMTLSAAAKGVSVGIGYVLEEGPFSAAHLFHEAKPFFVAADFGESPKG